MTEFRIVWQACPHVNHPRKVSFVEARDAEMARFVLTDHIERTTGITWFSVHSVEPYQRPTEGRVLP